MCAGLSCKCTLTLEIIQAVVLDEAAKVSPDEWWWVKADGCDVVPGIAESTRGVWSGDVDLNDGDLQKQFIQYQSRLGTIRKLSLTSRQSVLQQLDLHSSRLREDEDFLHTSKYFLNCIQS